MSNKINQIEAEERMERCNLSRELNFVIEHMALYKNIPMNYERSSFHTKWLENLEIIAGESSNYPQVTPYLLIRPLCQLPERMLSNSRLKIIDYTYTNSIIVPAFDDEGFLDFSRVMFVDERDFPGDKHPQRILVGYSNGTVILPTCIPKTVCDNTQAIAYYQMHVFLHEFCHTLLFSEQLKEDFWKSFQLERRCVSMYAENYYDDLIESVRLQYPNKWEQAIKEQIAECFVAYLFNVVPNHEERIDFKNDFPGYWQIMHDLFTTDKYFC